MASSMNKYLVEALTGPEKVSPGKDVALSTQSGLVKGMTALLGQGGDVLNLLKSLPPSAAKALEDRNIIPKGSAQALAFAIEQNGKGTAPQQLVNAGLQAGVRGRAKAMGASPTQAEAVGSMTPAIGAVNLPTSKAVGEMVGASRAQRKPQTKAGAYASTLAEFAPAGLFPGSAPQRIANVLLPGLASETAGQLTEGTPLEPWARGGAALVGGVTAGFMGRPDGATRQLAQASGNFTDDQIRAAEQLRVRAAEMGVDVTLAEAMDQISGGSTGMGRLQRVVEGTRRGSEVMDPYMSQRPGQVQSAISSVANNISPPTNTPSVIGMRAQEGATGAIRAAETARTNAVSPSYRAADPQTLQQQHLDDLLSAMDAEIAADRTGIIASKLAPLRDKLIAQAGSPGSPAVPGQRLPRQTPNGVIYQMTPGTPAVPPTPRVPITDIGSLDTIRKQTRDALALPQIGQEATTKFQAARVSHYLDQLDQMMETNPDFLAGKEQFAQITRDTIDPLTAGPLGKVAATDSVQAQTGALFPANPLEGAPAETAQALRLLQEQNPGVPAELLRQHLMRSANEATQNNMPGAPQWGGAKFAAQIAGNPEQRATLMAGADAVGDHGNDVASLLEVMEATGKRQAQGSKTAFNQQDLATLGEAGAVGELTRAAVNPTGIPHRLGQAYQEFRLGRNAQIIADALVANPQRATEILMEARRRLPPGAELTQIERLAATVGLSQSHPALPGQ